MYCWLYSIVLSLSLLINWPNGGLKSRYLALSVSNKTWKIYTSSDLDSRLLDSRKREEGINKILVLFCGFYDFCKQWLTAAI